MVSALKQRGVCYTFSNCIEKAGMLTVGVASLKKGQQRIYLVKANSLISGIYSIIMNFVFEFLSFHPFLPRKLPKENYASWNLGFSFVSGGICSGY